MARLAWSERTSSGCDGVVPRFLLILMIAGSAAGTTSMGYQQDDKRTDGGVAERQANHLIDSTSPYLLQHAYNPVDWYPWGDEAFEKARREDKPVFLSVGYSTCYWCHVMERESFEDEKVASVLNEHFVAIKVDREERPDIDEQYMLATQLLTRRGGWPNSVWLMPDGRPWMAGTYFPRENFIALLGQLQELWSSRRDEVEKQAESLADAIERTAAHGQSLDQTELRSGIVDAALDQTVQFYDQFHGGFGDAPKFPPHGQLRLLLAALKYRDHDRLRRMVTHTLDAMWQGGIHDHVGGGFHRYATDGRWFLPHFEKMLYDNAQLLRAYTDAYELTGNERYRRAVADIVRWLKREMLHPDGGFYSALDSESDGEEGKYYVWTRKEVDDILGPENGALWADVYGFEEAGNFLEESTRRRTGANIPYLAKALEVVAEEQDLAVEELRDRLVTMRSQLLDARGKRAYPHRDDKILASWNGLAIAALARAGDVFQNPHYTQLAERAADFVLNRMVDQKQGLLRSFRDGEARQPGFLDDYAFLLEGLVELYIATDSASWRDRAVNLADEMLRRFEDETRGGFFFAADDQPELLVRFKDMLGGGNVPSGNGVAAHALLRLGGLANEERYIAAARRTLESFSGQMAQSPEGSSHLLVATQLLLNRKSPSDTTHVGDGASRADGTYEFPPITARLYSSRLRVRPGETFQVAVELSVDDGWHVYAPHASTENLLPTTWALKADEVISGGEVDFPEPVLRRDEVLDTDLATYDGRIWLRMSVTVAENAQPGARRVTWELRVQACDQQSCLAPKTITMPLEVTIDPETDEASRYPKVFPTK